ncbi:hypothetical protein PUR37_26275, partial [Klebsiella pneumoniae]|uniref:hypothetical protein n=1 Tax=Klebsiella pneumoniae TaxID=573 RepID=UPI0023F98D7E
LINRDQLLAFTMGPAAVYFGGAVILTILAVEWLIIKPTIGTKKLNTILTGNNLFTLI